MVAAETLASGDFVNMFDASGVTKVRKADATDSGKRAHGFVKVGATSGQSVDVYLDGANNALTGLTGGTRYYLSAATPGAATAIMPSASGNLVQYLGTAMSATAIAFRPTDGTVLA
ncbi:MAG: hypothetical protein H7837_11435 [Magnetococcus sp. MYC-9]